MKYEIFEKGGVPVDIVRRVRLIYTVEGVSIAFVDETGEAVVGGYICTLLSEGMLRPCHRVTRGLGLQLENGCIKIEPDRHGGEARSGT